MAEPEVFATVVSVPAALVGRVIGKGGATVLAIREATGANISNQRAVGEGPVEFRVWGPTPEGVEAAKNQIVEIICKCALLLCGSFGMPCYNSSLLALCCSDWL